MYSLTQRFLCWSLVWVTYPEGVEYWNHSLLLFQDIFDILCILLLILWNQEFPHLGTNLQLFCLPDELFSLLVCSSFLHLFWLAWVEAYSIWLQNKKLFHLVCNLHLLSKLFSILWVSICDCLYQEGMFLRDSRRMGCFLVQSDGMCLFMINWSYLPLRKAHWYLWYFPGWFDCRFCFGILLSSPLASGFSLFLYIECSGLFLSFPLASHFYHEIYSFLCFSD